MEPFEYIFLIIENSSSFQTMGLGYQIPPLQQYSLAPFNIIVTIYQKIDSRSQYGVDLKRHRI